VLPLLVDGRDDEDDDAFHVRGRDCEEEESETGIIDEDGDGDEEGTKLKLSISMSNIWSFTRKFEKSNLGCEEKHGN
jgi:hypothetical protein